MTHPNAFNTWPLRSNAQLAMSLALLASSVWTFGCGSCQQRDANSSTDHASATDTPYDRNEEELLMSLPDVPAGPVERPSQEQFQLVARAINAFGVDFYPRLAAAKPGHNLVYSPASIAVAFAMVHAGAQGRSAEELRRAFHFGDDDRASQEAMGRALLWWNRDDRTEEVVLRVVNRLFGEETFHFEQSYLGLTRNRFRAPLASVDFRNNPETQRHLINSWVETETNERIKDLVPPGAIDQRTRLVVANAIYFKAQWLHEFLERSTRPTAFFRDEEDSVEVPMMRLGHTLEAASITESEGGPLKIIKLPYSAGEFAMYVLLPDAVGGLPSLERNLDSEKLEQWLGSLTTHDVRVELPKWEFEMDTFLRDLLGQLGVQQVFVENNAGLEPIGQSPIPGEKLYVSEGVHKAFIAVDENGTEAAAATAVVMMGSGAAPPSAYPSMEFKADHPFLFLIRDTRSDTTLFMGRVLDPS